MHNIDFSSEELRELDNALGGMEAMIEVQKAAIFNTMRILKKVNPGDAYYEAYLGHLARSGREFYDTYMLIWEIASCMKPRRILEIGTRTGISLCQLLSGYIDHSFIEEIICVDPFLDGWTSKALVKKNLAYLNLPVEGIEFFEDKSENVFPILLNRGSKFDYILVDGDHVKEAARKDLENAHFLIEEGGIIVFDDISDAPGECALIDVWQDFMKEHGADYTSDLRMIGKGVAWAVRNETEDENDSEN